MSESQIKTIELRKQSFINGDILIAAIICAITIVWFVMRHSGGEICLFLITALVVMPLVWRKFARCITVNFEARTICSIGIVSIFRQSITFDDLAYVRCPAAISLNAAKVFNVVFRRQGAVQPLVFEARSEAERTQARELLAELRRVMPNKMRDDAVS